MGPWRLLGPLCSCTACFSELVIRSNSCILSASTLKSVVILLGIYLGATEQLWRQLLNFAFENLVFLFPLTLSVSLQALSFSLASSPLPHNCSNVKARPHPHFPPHIQQIILSHVLRREMGAWALFLQKINFLCCSRLGAVYCPWFSGLLMNPLFSISPHIFNSLLVSPLN